MKRCKGPKRSLIVPSIISQAVLVANVSGLVCNPGLLELASQIVLATRHLRFTGGTPRPSDQSIVRRDFTAEEEDAIWPVKARSAKVAKAFVAVHSSEGELSRHLQQSTAKFLRSESKICRRGVSCCAGAGTIQRQIRLLRISGAKTIQCMIKEIEGGNAKTKVALAPQIEAFLRGKIRVEEGWPLRIREDILAVRSAVNARQAETGSVDVLV